MQHIFHKPKHQSFSHKNVTFWSKKFLDFFLLTDLADSCATERKLFLCYCCFLYVFFFFILWFWAMQRSCSRNKKHHNFSHKIHHNFGLGNLHHFFCQRLSRLSFSFYPCCFIYIFLLFCSSSSCDFRQCRGCAAHTYSTKQKPKFLSDTKSATFSLSPSLSQIEEFCMMCHCRRCCFSFLFVFFFILQFLGMRGRRRRCSTYCHSWS